MSEKKLGFDTLQVHAGQVADPVTADLDNALNKTLE